MAIVLEHLNYASFDGIANGKWTHNEASNLAGKIRVFMLLTFLAVNRIL